MDKTDRLLDAIEHPDRYSEKDMEVMLADPEVNEAYDLLGKTAASLTPIPSPDIDAEWDAFRRSHRVLVVGRERRPGILNLFSRNVAASIAIAIASLAAVAAVVGVGVNYVLDKKAAAPAAAVAPAVKADDVPDETISAPEDTTAVAPGTIVFDNEPLDAIVGRIAVYYGYSVEFAAPGAGSLRLYFRWNQAQTLDDVVESLNNFEQIHLTVKDGTIIID